MRLKQEIPLTDDERATLERWIRRPTTAQALAQRARIILWKGHCSVHGRFTVEQIEKARQDYPGIRVIVHPECTLDVVRAADLNGSTEYIIKQISEAPAGSQWQSWPPIATGDPRA